MRSSTDLQHSHTLIITKNFYPYIGGVETYTIEFIKYYIKKKPSSFLYIICPLKDTHLPHFMRTTNNIIMITPKINLTFVELDREKSIVLSGIQSMLYYSFILLYGIKLLFTSKNHISYIYGIGGPFSIFSSLILSRFFRKKCFGHIHADFQFVKRKSSARCFYRGIFNKLDTIFVNSKDAFDDLLKIKVNKERILIVHNWVDTSIFRVKDKQECRKSMGLPLDKKILLFVGRLSEEKGIMEVLNYAEKLKDNDNLIFIIIGDGALRVSVEKKTEGLTNVLYLGPKKSTELVDYYNASDCLFWGSVDVHYVSIIVMEALHCGLPVISPNISCQDGKRQYVAVETLPSQTGILIDGEGSQLLPIEIEEFLHTKFDRQAIKQYALERYSEKNARELLSHFADAAVK